MRLHPQIDLEQSEAWPSGPVVDEDHRRIHILGGFIIHAETKVIRWWEFFIAQWQSNTNKRYRSPVWAQEVMGNEEHQRLNFYIVYYKFEELWTTFNMY